jgi:hypothetical protein
MKIFGKENGIDSVEAEISCAGWEIHKARKETRGLIPTKEKARPLLTLLSSL